MTTGVYLSWTYKDIVVLIDLSSVLSSLLLPFQTVLLLPLYFPLFTLSGLFH